MRPTFFGDMTTIDSDDDSVVGFTQVDFSGVDFDQVDRGLTENEQKLLEWEVCVAFGESTDEAQNTVERLLEGDYASILRDTELLRGSDTLQLKERVYTFASTSIQASLEAEWVAVAALNLFLQANYTGPALEDIAALDEYGTPLPDINPHPSLAHYFPVENPVVDEEESKLDQTNTVYQNAVLAELTVDGEWPCQVCQSPYFLWLARTILSVLVEQASSLQAVHLWHARALVAHERLLQAREPSPTLWEEVVVAFDKCREMYCETATAPNVRAATVLLEWGLAQHHFDRPGCGRDSFVQSQHMAGLAVEVTGAVGKRTKFQQEATAQMIVKAQSSTYQKALETRDTAVVEKQRVEHPEEGILLERIRYDDDKENEVTPLSILDQTILLALCLDVKNSNPADGLTNEQMGAYLARVLDHHNDWMIYSTALLERSWVEFERSHAKERSILQMQALADQHTNRLTLTQSTKQSVEESAPVQDRLKNLHSIVYPPRWSMFQDLADRYASLGIVTSAAELYTEIEFWDDVVGARHGSGACHGRSASRSSRKAAIGHAPDDVFDITVHAAPVRGSNRLWNDTPAS